MTPPKSGIRKWVRALRSGEYRQTLGRLQDEWGYCCLGVLCKVTVPLHQQVTYKSGKLYGIHLDAQNLAPIWAQFVNFDFRDATGTTLIDLNDESEFTFDEIADLLEAVYLLEVLK